MDVPPAQDSSSTLLNSASSNQIEDDEKTVSEGSISEHLTSASASVENDRSLYEIEFSNNLSALPNDQPEPREDSLDLSSFGGYSSNGLPDNDKMDSSTGDGTKNARSILEEILGNSEFHSNNDDSKEESFNLFANVDLSDKSLINLSDNVKDSAIVGSFDLKNDLRQLVKDSTINALSQELDSFREMSNPTCMSSMVSATEYKQLQDECQAKLLEYNSAIAYKNDLIQQLSESLKQSVTRQKELTEQVDDFKQQITQLQTQLQEISKMVENHKCALPHKVPENCSTNLDSKHQTEQVANLKDYENLMELKLELEKKHAREVEELRTYFEKKCAELEKNYSEEIFSQHSRKLSGSSSEVELSADYLLSSQPGPGGDLKRVFKTKDDVKRLMDNLNSFANKLSKHSLEDINDKGLANIEIEVKNELNVLFKIGEKLEIQAVESKYREEISNLRFQLEEEVKRHGNLSMGSVIQEVANSGDYELNEVVESYERRLQEQIAMAKIDIINSIEVQIQRLASNEDEDWPSELLQLRDRFTEKYEEQIKELKNQHETEMARLKEEHLKILNGALERARRRSLKEGDSLTKADVELLKERDNLKRQVVSQRNLLTELVKYFSEAEDELNNTLVESLIKQDNEMLLDQAEEPDHSSGATASNSSKIFDSLSNKTRVHFAPNFSELLNMIEHQSQQNNESLDVSVELKNELGICLEKLKKEANAILALSSQPKRVEGESCPKQDWEAKFHSINQELLCEVQRNDRLKSELFDSNQIISSLEKEKELLENRVEQLLERLNIIETDLVHAKTRIADIVEGRGSEVVSEGYGEGGQLMMQGLEDTTAALTALQEKAQSMLVQSRTSMDPDVLQLIEELCQVSETVKVEAKKETRDLLQQIESADKKYKTTQKFLEEQAAEREQERDEAQKKIDSLQDQLRDRDKDRVNCQIMSKEADQLEQQIADLNNHLTDQQVKYKELESERDEAVEKIKILRDIIKELEQANDAKERDLEEHLRHVERLECIINEQRATFDDYTSRTSLGDVSDVHKLRQHCEQLEEEVQQLRIGAELAGSEGVLKQLKLQLFEIEANLDKKTKALEQLHSSGTSCSSPSEDMSVRDLVRPQTPAAMDECEVPLQQLARLKEKLLRHSRAEEAAIKRIHDLEMELAGLKSELEEVGNEKEVMKRQIQEQVVLISDFQIRLDQQRIKAEHIERQTNSSLETKIYDQQNEILHLQEKLRSREKVSASQEKTIEELRQRVKDLEDELADPKEDEVIVELQKELEALRVENQILKEKPSTESQILPSLMENILQDKNSDIEKLKTKLAETEQQLLSYTTLNLDKNDLKTLAELKNSGGSIEQLISILDLSQPMVDRARHCASESAILHRPIVLKKNDMTEFLDCSSLPEISSIQKTGNNFNYTSATPLGKPNSTELSHRSTEKRVRFETSESSLIETVETLKVDLDNKNKIIAELEGKLSALHDLEEQTDRLQTRLDETEAALVTATQTFEKERENSLEKEQKLGVELAEKKLIIDKLEKEVQALKDDSVRKDEMHLNLAREKRDLETQLLEQKRESFESLDRVLKEKNRIIEELQSNEERLKKELEEAVSSFTDALFQAESLKTEVTRLKDNTAQEVSELKEKNTAMQQQQSELNNQRMQLQSTVDELRKLVEEKDAKIKDSACEIDILNEDLKEYQNELAELADKLKEYENQEVERKQQMKLLEMTKEVTHLQELVKEKDRMIAQMTEDHNTVHAKLEVVNHKITETGNIFDLSKRLKQEQKKNADLHACIQKLKASLLNYEVANAAPVEEITGQVKKELECAAQIDSNIMNAVSDQSLSSISEGQDAEIYMKALTRQKNQNKQLLRHNDRLEKQKLHLEQRCNQFEMRLNEMQNELEKENLHKRRLMIEDAKLIEQLRMKLEATLELQKVLEKLLEEEKRCRRMLDVKCEELKKPSSSSESTKYKSLPTPDNLEIAHLKKDLESVKEEKEKWCKQAKTLRLKNDELKSDVTYAKEMLALETERNRAHEEKIRILTEKERSLSEELLRKRFELEVKEREMEEKKIKMDELEQEKTVLEKQKSKLVKVLKTQSPTPIATQDGALLPEQLTHLIAELKQMSDENKNRLEHIEKLEKEKIALEKQLRAEMRKNMDGNMPYVDLVERCNYLFAKSLKLESVRKALVWQKRFLVDRVKSFQTCYPIRILPIQPHDEECLRHKCTPIVFFRAAVQAVMSIHRMKFLVRRWHTGKRKYDKINARHYQTSTERYMQENQGANFQVGQPVSNQIFFQKLSRVNLNNPFNSNNPFRVDEYHEECRTTSPALSGASHAQDIPWSGQTPPSKDYPHHRIGARETYAPLRAPELLNQLHERVEQVQERLSLPLRADPT